MKILLADDDWGNIELMKATLRRLGGELEIAVTGREAVEKAKSFCPDIILLDVMMPEMDGYKACAVIKESPETQHIPVIMITALSDRRSRLKGLSAGADDFLSKPVDGTELLARIENFFKLKVYQDKILAKKEALERLGELKSDLVNMIVHDLKGPLTSIHGYIQLAAGVTDENSSQLDSYLSEADQNCNALLDMLNSLLDISCMEEGKISLQRVPVDVFALFQKVRGMFLSSAEREGKRVVIEATPQLPLHADPDLLERVLQNLVSNALRYVEREAGEVRLSMKEDNGEALFTVADNGKGIPDRFKERIFEKYAQVEKCGATAGTGQRNLNKGLGLTFCKLAVEAHGGEIRVESAEGKGSRFHFSIPVREEKVSSYES